MKLPRKEMAHLADFLTAQARAKGTAQEQHFDRLLRQKVLPAPLTSLDPGRCESLRRSHPQGWLFWLPALIWRRPLPLFGFQAARRPWGANGPASGGIAKVASRQNGAATRPYLSVSPVPERLLSRPAFLVSGTGVVRAPPREPECLLDAFQSSPFRIPLPSLAQELGASLAGFRSPSPRLSPGSKGVAARRPPPKGLAQEGGRGGARRRALCL